MENNIVVSGKRAASIKHTFIKLLIGQILGWVVYIVGAFADSIIGGYTISEEALAAIEIVLPVYTLIYFLAYLISIGGGILHARAIGKNDFKKADSIYSTGIYFNIILGILLGIGLYFLKEPWLDLYELEGALRQYAGDYYDAYVYVGLFMPLGLYFYCQVNYDGDIFYTVLSDFIATIMNVALSLILVGPLGIKGLSLSTAISLLVSYIIPVFYLFSKANTLKLKWVFSFKDLFDSFKLSIPTVVGTLAVAVLDIIINYYISGTYSAEYSAPYAVVNFALEIASALALAGSTMGTLLNFYIGENNVNDIKELLKISKIYTAIIALGFSVVFMACTPFWPILFGLETDEFIEAATIASLSIGASFIAVAFCRLIGSYLIANDKIIFSTVSGIVSDLICPMIFPILLSMLFGYNGLVAGFAVSNIATFIVMYGFLLIKNKGIVFELPKCESKQYSIDLLINDDSISKTTVFINDILKENNIDSKLSNKVQLTIEESLLLIKKANKIDVKSKKKVYGRILVDINSSRVKIIEKDTGKVFDVTNKDQKVSDLNSYLYVLTSTKSNKTVNYVASSVNGNHYEFNI